MVEIKGLSGATRWSRSARRLGQEGLERFLATASPEARGLFVEPVNVSAWYPLDAYADLLAAEVRADGGDPGGLVGRAERILEKQLSGVYRVFVRLGSPEAVVKRISGAHETYFRGTQVAVLACEKGAAAVRYTGFTERHGVVEHAIQAFHRRACSSPARRTCRSGSGRRSRRGPGCARWRCAGGERAGTQGRAPPRPPVP